MVSAWVLSLTLFLAGCSSFPESPAVIGADYPSSGIPTDVAWPSDWLEGFYGESDAVGGPIVGLRLEYVDASWVWRIRSLDPGADVLGQRPRESTRGREALVDASSLALVTQHEVELSEAELADPGVGPYEAAQLSGETYPSPRLIGLELTLVDNHPTWSITTYDTETDAVSVTSVDASSTPAA
ncbi:hypothetical protein [Agromyces terreus]|uniref:hypothetical protein n=1 Tax=Agromyces terreus TaxID=424795 RepID=UPI0012ED45BC|nr:hypothetical protein [Agromyces terreus]